MNFKLKEKTVLAVAFLAIISIGSLLSVADQIDQPSHQRVSISSSDPVYIPAYNGDPSGIAPVSLTAHDWSDLVEDIIEYIPIVQGGELIVSNNVNGVVSKTTSDGDGFYTGVLSIGTEGTVSSNLVTKGYVDAAVAGAGGSSAATDVTASTTGFNKVLGVGDSNVQLALDTIDNTPFLLGASGIGTDGFVTEGSSYTSKSVIIAPSGGPITPASGAESFVAIGAGGSWIVSSSADDQFAAVGNNIDVSYRCALLGMQVDAGTASGAIGVGYDADIAGNYGVAIGYQTKTTTDGVSVGYRAESKQRPDAVSIGSDSNAGDDGVIAIGAHADVRNDDSAFGADSVILIGDTMAINDSVEYEPFMQVGANNKAWWEAGPNTPYNYLTDANYSDDRDFDTEAWTRTAYRIFNEEGDPTEPAANHSVLWVADGTGTRGDEGDLVIAVNDGTSTKYKILFDFSAEGTAW